MPDSHSIRSIVADAPSAPVNDAGFRTPFVVVRRHRRAVRHRIEERLVQHVPSGALTVIVHSLSRT